MIAGHPDAPWVPTLPFATAILSVAAAETKMSGTHSGLVSESVRPHKKGKF
jgi:hypothetical protein